MSAKIRTIKDIDFRYMAGDECCRIFISKDSFIKVTEEKAIYWCTEDIEAMSPEEQLKLKVKRQKKAVRTGFFSLDNLTKPHIDYTFL